MVVMLSGRPAGVPDQSTWCCSPKRIGYEPLAMDVRVGEQTCAQRRAAVKKRKPSGGGAAHGQHVVVREQHRFRGDGVDVGRVELVALEAEVVRAEVVHHHEQEMRARPLSCCAIVRLGVGGGWGCRGVGGCWGRCSSDSGKQEQQRWPHRVLGARAAATVPE